MSLVRRAASGILWAQIGSVLETILGIALSIFVIRKLGPVDYGAYGLLLSITGLLPLLTRLGFEEVLGKYIPALTSAGRSDQVAGLLRWLLAGRVAASALALGLVYLLAGLLGRLLRFPDLAAYIAPLALLFVTQEVGQLFSAFFTAELRLRHVTVYNLILRCSSLALTLFLFMRYGVSVIHVLYASIAGLALGLGWYAFASRRALWQERGERAELRPVLGFGVNTALVNLTQVGLGAQKDTFLLGALSTREEVGYYKAASGLLITVAGFLFGRWANMTLPVLSEAHSRQGTAGLARAWSAYIRLLSLIGVPVFAGLAVFAAPVVHFLITDAYTQTITLMQVWSLVSLVVIVLGQGLGTLLLYVLGRERVALLFRLVGSLAGIGLDLLLIPWLGALGAVVATGIVSVGIVLAEIFFAARYVPGLRYPLPFVGKILLATGVACLPALALGTVQLWSFLLTTALFGGIFVLALHLLRPLEESDRELVAQVDRRLAVIARWF